mmetsp:Transcript_28295/g.41804  ORF Transcript_28295/g.41804 Transcript_28295/m.41804 type:complete len:494 (-) Transcript_28295:219-1700(-)
MTVSNQSIGSRLCPPYQGNKEALGWALDGVARIIGFIAPAVFLSTSIINIAKKEAGCTADEECQERIYGLKPSSFLTTYGTIVGLTSAVCLPILGAIMDHTKHRKLVGQVTAIIQLTCIFVQIFVNESNWFYLGVLVQIISGFIGWMHTVTVFAYLPELTNDENLLVSWTANFHMLQYLAMLLFLAYMLGLLYATGYSDDPVLSNRSAMISCFVITAPLFLITWTRLMKPRDALQQLPSSSSIWTIGFKQVYHTCQKLVTTKEYRAIMWFFLNVMVVEAAQTSIATICLTYMTNVLQMTSDENGIAIMILFIGAAIGTIVGEKLVKWTRINPIQSNQLSQIISAVNTSLAALILTGPGQQALAYVVAAIWGIGVGWKITIERFIVCQIIPKDQDAEFMGFYLFASQILVWLPTLVFTAMNEAGVSQRIGLLSLTLFFVAGVGFLCMMGSYEEAVTSATHETHEDDDNTRDAEDSSNADGQGEEKKDVPSEPEI